MASDGDVARLIDPILEVPLAIALVVIAVAGSSWRRRISTDPAKPGSPPPTEGAGVPDRLRGARRMAFAIGLVAMALRVPWSPPEPMDHLEYALVVETDLAETWRDVLVNRVGIEQAHQPLSRVPIALARHLGLRPETTRWFQLAAWGLALAGAWCWTRLLAGSWTGAPAARADGVALASFAWVAWAPLGARYGFDATPYGLFVAFAWWGAVTLVRIGRGSAGWRWPAVALGAAAFYTHYVELWFFVGATAIAWLETSTLPIGARRRARLDLVVVAACLGLAVVPWLPAMRWGAALFRGYVSREVDLYAMDFPWWAQLRETFRIATGWPGWTGLGALLGATAYLGRRGDRAGRIVAAAVVVGLAPYFAFRAVQQYQYAEASGGTYFGARHVLPFVPLVVLPVVAALERAGVSWLPTSASPRARLAVLAVLPLAALASTVAGRTHAERPDIREAARYLRGHLQDGDAVGVLPRFFYSALVVDEVSAGQVRFQDASGFARLPLGRADRDDPLVWLPADDREFPFPAALENRAFRRVWVLDFQEREFGLLELAPKVSREVTAHMDAAHRLVERRAFDQLVLSLYLLRDDRERWNGEPWLIDDATWRDHARDVSWTVDGGRATYRIDLPSPAEGTLAELALSFAATDDASAAKRVRLRIDRTIDETFELPPSAVTRTVQVFVPAQQPLVVRLEYPGVVARAPSRVVLRAALAGP
ncbi:MAG: hypothetical protein IPK07_29420 [Deltaproteobacteria bacterium]|nr:hypothetical protein [Deltaproteobacteria bacterium]